MLQGLRSIIPLSLSGVLAFLGLWWYTSRKKGRLGEYDFVDQMLPKKGDGDVTENGLFAETDGPNLEVAASANTQVAADHSSPPLNQVQPEEITAHWDGTAGGPIAALDCAGPLSSVPLRLQPAPEDGIHKQQLKEEALSRKSLSSINQGNVTPVSKPLSETIDTSTIKPQLLPLPTTPVTFSCNKTKLRADGERPDPEGEVGEDKNIVNFSEIKPQTDQTERSAGSKNIHSSCLFSMELDPGSCPPDGSSMYDSSCQDHMSQLAVGLVTEVVSAAVSEVLAADTTENNILGQINQPTHENTILEEESAEWTSQILPQFQETKDKEDCNSISSLSESTHGEDYQGESLLLETIGDSVNKKTSQEQVDRLCIVNSTVKDRGTEEYQYFTESKQLTVSHREIGCGDQHGTSLPLELQNSSKSSPPPSPLLTIWEIEVPKHLVGRLIGKQGRYVSYLKETSGAKVFVTTLPYTQEVQICHIEGTQLQVETTLDLIRLKFKDLELINCYAQPPVASLPALPITSWLLLPHGVSVEVTVVQVASGNYVFLQQHTHPTFYALPSLDQQMALCYSQPGCPTLPAPAEVGVICAAQRPAGAWYRAQVMSSSLASQEVEVRYVDYGGYDTVNMGTLRQIRSDFVALPFQASEVILENITPLAGEGAKSALEELTRGLPLVAQVTDLHRSGIPLVQLWRRDGDQLVAVNQTLVERGLCSWINSPAP